jgi:FkbM family methyltransferase
MLMSKFLLCLLLVLIFFTLQCRARGVSRHHSTFEEDVIVYQSVFSNFSNEMLKHYWTFEAGAVNGIGGSNSFFFENFCNMKALLVEGSPNNLDALKHNRPNAINLNIGLASEPGVLEYVFFNNKYRNGFSKFIRDYSNESTIKEVRRQKIPVKTLAQVFEENRVEEIAFFALDTEGSELDILKGIDFSKIKIHVMMIEGGRHEAIKSFLLSNQYVHLGNIGWDCIYMIRKSIFLDGKSVENIIRRFYNTTVSILKMNNNGTAKRALKLTKDWCRTDFNTTIDCNTHMSPQN